MRGLVTLLALCCVFAVSAHAQASIVINEVVYDTEGSDVDCWLELKGEPGMSLDGYTVVGVNGNGGADYNEIALDGFAIPADGYFLITQDENRPDSDYWNEDVNYQNGPDSIQLRYLGDTVDAVGYGSFDSAVFAGEGDPAPDVTPPFSLARCPDGEDSDNNAVDFIADGNPTPGAENMGDCDQQPTDRSICEIAENDPATGRPALEGEYVRVTGISLMESDTWAGNRIEFSITDGECCTNVFWNNNTDPYVQRGDEVEVIGTVGFYNGKTQVTTPNIEINILSTGNPIPEPTEVSTYELATNGEMYESCLLKLTCITIDPDGDQWPPEGEDANMTVDDGSGPTTLRIDRDTNIDGSAPPEGEFSAIGIGGQFAFDEPYDTGYQLVMRDLDDVLYDDCLPPTGACCFADGSCQELLEDECTQVGGEYWIEGEVCEPNPCEPVATYETTWGKIKANYR
ncbi:MAG: hypothetical protein GF346_05680 [Candidatus Eisenbacteria bacterium]|nr:hypothetical protein [Candidatus Latescibacterota bacterium]MBD3301919.1 hypothetical protein [Candidatus Eisenbacteria bacterium]